jgi:hypothetical protein
MTSNGTTLTELSTFRSCFLDIIHSAVALRGDFDRADEQEKEGMHPAAVHHPDEPYSDQDLVSLCCLADREREADMDTRYAG